MPTNRKEHVRFRYGICLNDGCSKCKSKEVQQIAARKDFVCEECQKPLRECPPPKSFWDKYGKLTIGASVTVIAAGLACVLIPRIQSGNTADTPEPYEPDTITAHVPPIVEPIDTAVIDTITSAPKEPAKTDPHTADATPKASIQVPFGTYSGPADGLNGEITVTRSYTLNLRNAAHESIELLPGDVIDRTKFKDGELVSGYWHRGTQNRSFHR